MSTKTISDSTKFAYWVPNVSGGLVTSNIEQRTSWDYDYNVKLAQIAENAGFEYALSQVRYLSSYNAVSQHEPTAFSLALLLATQKLKLITAVLPGLWNPAVIAKIGATIDQITGGRFAINVVSGWFKKEFTAMGVPWLEHDERYRQSEEFIKVVRKIWESDNAEFTGDFFKTHDFTLNPKPVQLTNRPYPEIFQGGNSTAAREMAGRVSDWYFSNGKDFDGVTEQIVDVRKSAEKNNREVKFGLNAFVIARDTEAEAHETLREIIAKADEKAVKDFYAATKEAGRSTTEKKGMWADSNFDDLVQYNDGFKTRLIGTPEQIALRINEYRKLGVDLILSGFLHFQEEVDYFGKKVLPLVRQLESK